ARQRAGICVPVTKPVGTPSVCRPARIREAGRRLRNRPVQAALLSNSIQRLRKPTNRMGRSGPIFSWEQSAFFPATRIVINQCGTKKGAAPTFDQKAAGTFPARASLCESRDAEPGQMRIDELPQLL